MAVLQRHKSNIFGLVSDLALLQSNIDAEALTRSTNDGDLTALTTTEKSNLVGAINELVVSINAQSSSFADDLAAEEAARIAADAEIQAELDATQTGAGLGEDGSYTANGATNYISGATSIVNATELLDAQAKTNSDAIAQEIIDRQSGDTTLQSNIDAEESARIAADNTLQSNIDAEESARIAADSALEAGLADLSGVTDVPTARTNLDVFSKGEVAAAITEAGLNLGTNFSTQDAASAATDFPAGSLSVGDNVFVVNDGDSKWAIYKVIAITDGAYSTSTLEKIMDEDVYLNAQSAETIKTTYESNADTNAFTDEDAARVSRIGDSTTVLSTTATEVFAAINELVVADSTLQSNIDSEESARIAADSAIQAELDASQAGAGLETDGSYVANGSANYIAAATSLKDADNKLDAQIKVNSDAIAQEVADRTAADSTLDAKIDQEISDRQADTALSLRIANNLSDLADVAVARTNLDVYSKSETDSAIALGGAIFTTEVVTVTSDKIVLANAPKNGVVFNFATVRHVDANFVSYDVPVTVDGADVNGKTFTLSPDSAGQFDGKSVTVQYAYTPSV